VRAGRRVDVYGLVPYRSGVLLADNTGGRLYAVPDQAGLANQRLSGDEGHSSKPS
jgi:hypothetical protein